MHVSIYIYISVYIYIYLKINKEQTVLTASLNVGKLTEECSHYFHYLVRRAAS